MAVGLTSEQRLIRNELLLTVVDGSFNPYAIAVLLQHYSRDALLTVSRLIFDDAAYSDALLQIIIEIENTHVAASKLAQQLATQLSPTIDTFTANYPQHVPWDLVLQKTLQLLQEKYQNTELEL